MLFLRSPYRNSLPRTAGTPSSRAHQGDTAEQARRKRTHRNVRMRLQKPACRKVVVDAGCKQDLGVAADEGLSNRHSLLNVAVISPSYHLGSPPFADLPSVKPSGFSPCRRPSTRIHMAYCALCYCLQTELFEVVSPSRSQRNHTSEPPCSRDHASLWVCQVGSVQVFSPSHLILSTSSSLRASEYYLEPTSTS